MVLHKYIHKFLILVLSSENDIYYITSFEEKYENLSHKASRVGGIFKIRWANKVLKLSRF